MSGETLFSTIDYEKRTLPDSIERSAERFGDRLFITAPGGTLTFSESRVATSRVARGLRSLGVDAGQNVALFANNRIELPTAWWATAWAGAVAVLIHSAYRGAFLSRAIDFCDARVLIVDNELLPEVAEVAATLPKLEAVVVAGGGEFARWEGPRFLTWDELASEDPLEPANVNPLDPATIMYTSGTTGPSKAVVKSHHYEFVYAAFTVAAAQLEESSHIWSCLPATHVTTANSGLYAALLSGAEITLTKRFSARSFWAEAARYEASHVYSLGSMANILMKQDPGPQDTEHKPGMVMAAVPPPYDPREFEHRFSVRLISQGFGMTEIYPIPHELAKQDWNQRHNFIGRANDAYEVRIADPDGRPAPSDGSTKGEILIRPRVPGYMMSGYYKDPAATVSAWRDLWFHTGDLATMDEDGFLHYEGRTSDSIRRRGENISAHELEQIVMSFPAVSEAAAYGVPSEVGEEDVKVDVVWADPEGDDAAATDALIEFLIPRLPFFMVPRYIQVREQLPKTPSQKVQKHLLRAEGIPVGVFDRGSQRPTP